jgi:polyisoprenoid-binding protein YceI
MKTIFAAASLALLSIAQAPAQAQAASYKLDPTHTFVTFEVLHFGTSTVRGRFDKKEGSVQFDRAGRSGQLELTIDTTSISSGIPTFDKHLKGADFFDVEKHPAARFTADRFNFDGDQVKTITGSLSLLGKTGPVTLTASRFNCYMNPLFKREVCGGDFATTIKRSDWGMGYGLNFGIPDEVRLVVQAEAIRQ